MVLNRRQALLCSLVMLSGCNGLDIRSQSPEPEAEDAPRVKLVGDLAFPFGLEPIKVEAISLVTGLQNTGSDPAPSAERTLLLHELQKRGVPNPNQLLASPHTSLVVVRGYLRPGIQKGDHFDVEVRVPSRSETSSLRNGFMLSTHLKEMAVLGGQVRDGNLLALAEGAVLVDPGADPHDKVAQNRARILGGGVALKARSLGLVIRKDDKSVRTSAQIGEAVNRRFHSFNQGVKEGVAKPKTDHFLDLAIHPRYKDNVQRYVQVIRAIPLRESPTEQQARIKQLSRQLLDPISAATAALRLEALGKEAIPTLKSGLASADPEVRFYAAEALAYLDDKDAAKPLAEAARNEPAFRAYALAALSAMDEVAAYDELAELLHLTSAETRYGAFRALWAMNNRDPLVKGEELDGKFSLHVLRTTGPEMVHVTRSRRPEVVLFGQEIRFATPLLLDAGKNIMVKAIDENTVAVSRFAVGEPAKKVFATTRVDDVVRKIVELGGAYPDVVQVLQQAKAKGVLAARFEMDALPQPAERRAPRTEPGEEADESHGLASSSPVPDLFGRRESPNDQDDKRPETTPDENPAAEERSWWDLYGKWRDWRDG